LNARKLLFATESLPSCLKLKGPCLLVLFVIVSLLLLVFLILILLFVFVANFN
jgi:hypothetical protein